MSSKLSIKLSAFILTIAGIVVIYHLIPVRKLNTQVVCLVTMPKSGTDFVHRMIKDNLNYIIAGKEHKELHNAVVSFDPKQLKTILAELKKTPQKKYIVNTHFYEISNHRLLTHPEHYRVFLEVMKDNNIPVIIHFRDPRQATLSHIHYLNGPKYDEKMKSDQDDFRNWPNKYWKLSLSQQIDFWLQEDDLFNGKVVWLRNWIELADSHKYPNVLLTEFDEIYSDHTEFLIK